MKKLAYSTIFALLIIMPKPLYADMTSYCSAPPYVTRSIAPNIMVLADNSDDMYNSAYTDAYIPYGSAGHIEHIGYFLPGSCYKYASNTFQEVPYSGTIPSKGGGSGTANSYTSYTFTNTPGTCPSSAPFRGDLLNWATMSKYDVLQKVIIGGNSTSKQSNANTLLSISGSWSKTYNNCVFNVSSANLTLTETGAGLCTLLDTTPTAIAFLELQWLRGMYAWFAREAGDIYAFISSGIKGISTVASTAWEKIDIVTKAWAAAGVGIQSGTPNGTVNQTYSITFECTGTGSDCPTGTYTWSFTNRPAWLSTTTYATSGQKVNYRVTLSGTPTGCSSFNLGVNLTGAATASNSFAITINSSALSLNTAAGALTSGTVGAAYSYSMNASGGVTSYTWSVSSGSLPAGLSLDSSTGVISGTPTTAGTSSFNITVQDSATSGCTRQSVTKSYSITIAASSLAISTTSPLPDGAVNTAYTVTLLGTGGSGSYTWSLSSGTLPSGLSLSSAGVLSGTPAGGSAGNYSFTIALYDGYTTVTKTFSLTITSGGGATPTITTTSPLPDAVKNTAYSFTMTATNGQTPYTWSATGLPASLSMSSGGVISGTPAANEVGAYSVVVTVRDNNNNTATQTFTLNVVISATIRSGSYNVKVDIVEEPFTDSNGNDACCDNSTEQASWIDYNGDGQWNGKYGVFNKFWDSNTPKARWGLTNYSNRGVDVTACIPASPSSSYYTAIQNATANNSSTVTSALYGIVNYYGFNTTNFPTYGGTGYVGCNNADPIDTVPCRKNFVLILSSGYSVTGTSYPSGTAGCSESSDLAQNACVGYKKDLRPSSSGTQNVYTYIVNTMGANAANNTVMQNAASAGHGKYYDASNSSNLSSQLQLALTDILAQAASGTAVSVLTTSSRGIGSMVQAYFLPSKQDGTREVWWTGYLQNLWIDPKDNLREDTDTAGGKTQLELDKDYVLKLYFDSSANETKAATYTTDANGENMSACANPPTKKFLEIAYLWEAGKKLALRPPSERTLFTAKKVLKTSGTATITTTTTSFTNNNFTLDHVTGSASGNSTCAGLTGDALTLCNALDRDTTSATATTTDDDVSKIVRYVRGECLETVSGGDTCTATANNTFRDRRLTSSTVDGLPADPGAVWKLGDIISSTPKVFANTPLNTYHIDYGDSSYYNYIASNTYKKKSSIAFVGANDGVLHAFRVGYLKDTGLTGTVKALFRNFFGTTATDYTTEDTSNANDKLGEEVWGYIPFNAFPYLKYLADTGYCHIYFNDLSVRLVDASIGGSSALDGSAGGTLSTDTRASDGSNWRAVLIGGMRFGGACAGGTPDKPSTVSGTGYSAYYAIDITDPENPIPLWEFSDEDMGYATTFPSVIRTGDPAKNGYWYAVFGSGSKQLPKSSTDISRGSAGYVYIVNLKTGALAKKIALDHNAIVGDILAIDKEKDYHSEKIYFGTAYYDAAWKGKLTSIAIPNQDLSAAWTPTITYHFSGSYPFTASPDVAKDTDGNVWMYAGSGKYYSDVDDSDTSGQIFLGMKDSYSNKTTANLDDRTSTNTTGTVTGTAQICGYDTTDGTFKLLTYVTSISPTSALPSASAIGWYVNLGTAGSPAHSGERVITRPLAVGGLVDFLTYVPSSDVCSYGGDSYLYAVGYTTGVAPTNVAISSSAITGGVTSGGVTVAKGMKLGPGAPPTGEAIIVPPPKEGQETLKKKIQIATGVIVEAENQPVTSVISKIVHWLRK